MWKIAKQIIGTLIVLALLGGVVAFIAAFVGLA